MTTRTPFHTSLGRTPDKIMAFSVAGSTSVVIAGSLGQLMNYFLDLGIDALDSTDDGGVLGVVGDLATASAAGAAWLALVRVRPTRADLITLPPLLTFIAVDKAFRLHDHVPHYLVVYAPVLLGAFLCLVAVVRRAPRSAARLLVAGLALLAVSFALHAVGERMLLGLGLENAGWAHQVKAVVKHGCEIEGWFLVVIGLASTAVRGRQKPSGRPIGSAHR